MAAPFVNPLSRGSAGVVGKARDIKAWTRELFGLSDDAVVSVNELACHMPGCPPKETVVLMMLADRTVQVSIHKPMLDVSREDIATASSKASGGGGQ
ncbi:hypothetical protein [Rhizobium sp. RU36D]|uniref:hypothetical protein n=1 Tax=Rhizobium sp. RU36D TaxID=1907415 RepID=UPI0009D85616|nr:hypothetical protein [Rhizobium sp. RU36D]SMD17616.1 hypothetical protein SAMN05880593_1333 [Rhizobium sp. RU36D]